MVSDQIANPTWARILAEMTAQVLGRGEDFIHTHAGLYHLAGSGFASRFEWARAILDLDPARAEQTVNLLLPAESVDFPTPATRPLFSALNCDSFLEKFDLRLPDWKDTLALAMGNARGNYNAKK